MIIRPLVLVFLASLAAGARADRMPILADAPPAFKAECGSCHIAFPPALLVADDWRRVMASLDRHYGDNASLDDKTRQALTDFLVRNAGGSGRSRITAAAGDPPRLTRTSWFERKHDEVPAVVWKDKRVGSAANCAACHSRADQGSYSEREIILPGGRRWE
jgi:cytochrome c553